LGLFRNFRKAGIVAGLSFSSRHCWLKTAISLWILLGTELCRREWKSGTKEMKVQDKRTEVWDERTGVRTPELLMMGIDLEGWRIATVDNKIISQEGGVKPKEQTPEGRGTEGQGN